MEGVCITSETGAGGRSAAGKKPSRAGWRSVASLPIQTPEMASAKRGWGSTRQARRQRWGRAEKHEWLPQLRLIFRLRRPAAVDDDTVPSLARQREVCWVAVGPAAGCS